MTTTKPRPAAPETLRHGLGQRLTQTAMLSAGVALLLAGLLFVVVLYFALRSAMLEDLVTQARVTADYSSAAVIFREKTIAESTLSTLESSPNILHVELRDSDGELVARYDTRGRAPQALPGVQHTRQMEIGHRYTLGALIVEVPVYEHGQIVGSMRLLATLRPLWRRIGLYVALTILSGMLALSAAFLLATRTRRAVTTIEERLGFLAYFDVITGLRNRHAAMEEVSARTHGGQPDAGGFTLMLLDLDDFKIVNDTLGHTVGDALLRAVGERLTKFVQPNEGVFRLGGDEFLVLAPHAADEAQLRLLGQSAMAALSEPFTIEGQDIQVRVSAGISCHPEDATDYVGLVRAADVAMYSAKTLGKNTFEVYRTELAQANRSRLQLEQDLRSALEGQALRLEYQPILDVHAKRIVGFEALMRWHHPERGPISPAEFIPVAESSGLIIELGEWALHTACRQIRQWSDAGHEDFYVAVNVSARQIRRGILSPLRHAVAQTGVDPTRLEIELTEHSLVEDVDSNIAQLHALRQMGVSIAVDDFGTGLSSLSYLTRLPATKIKIDRSFIKDLPHQTPNAAIVTAVISMAHSLNLDVVAEGVETAAQRDDLLHKGCRLVQGYLYSPALPAQAVTELLEGRSPPASQRATEGSGAAAWRAITRPASL
jgi:diguanylate cyclase